MVTGNLFDFPDSESASFRSKLAASLSQLSGDRIYVGASSWKYEGWLDQIYTRANYLSRGKFSKRVFEAECLREYAEIFPTVCGDFAFYQFPSEIFWQRLFSQAPAGFQFAFKIPEQITCKLFPNHPRYGAQGGMPNPAILEAYNVERSTASALAAGGDGQGTRLGDVLEDTARALGGTVTRWEPIKDGNVWHLRAHVSYP